MKSWALDLDRWYSILEMVVTRTQPAINIFYSWHFKLNSLSLAGFWKKHCSVSFCQFLHDQAKFANAHTLSRLKISHTNFLSIWNAKSISLLIKLNLNVFDCHFQVLRMTLLWLISDCALVHQLLPVVLTIKRRICHIFHTIEILKFYLRKIRNSCHFCQQKWERFTLLI